MRTWEYPKSGAWNKVVNVQPTRTMTCSAGTGAGASAVAAEATPPATTASPFVAPPTPPPPITVAGTFKRSAATIEAAKRRIRMTVRAARDVQSMTAIARQRATGNQVLSLDARNAVVRLCRSSVECWGGWIRDPAPDVDALLSRGMLDPLCDSGSRAGLLSFQISGFLCLL